MMREQQARTRACNACREAKRKCIVTDNESKCDNCQKNKRPCVVSTARKSRLKTAERFAALEKQIQALEKTAPIPNLTSYNQHIRNSSLPGQDKTQASQFDEIQNLQLDVQTVQLLINHWNINMRVYFPFGGMIDSDLSSEGTGHTLFILVLSVASLAILPAISKTLIEMASSELVTRVYHKEEQSTELVLALLLHSQFLAYHTRSAKFKFSPYVYTASAMAVDLGLDRIACGPKPYDSCDAANSARVWLARYCVMSISTSLLRRQQLAEEEINLEGVTTNLVESSYRVDTDRTLCELAKLHQIINQSSKLTAAKSQATWDDCTTRSRVTKLHNLLEIWLTNNMKTLAPNCVDNTMTLILYGVCKLYIYRLAIISFRLKFISLMSLQQQSQLPTKQQTFDSDHILLLQNLQKELSFDHKEALETCLASCSLAISCFNSLSISRLRDLPLSYYHWMLFTVVCLLKLAPLAESSQQSKPQSTSTYDHINDTSITAQLGMYTDKLEEICKEGHVSQLNIFLKIMQKLQVYYVQRKELCMNSLVDGCNHDVQSGDARVLNLHMDDLKLDEATETVSWTELFAQKPPLRDQFEAGINVLSISENDKILTDQIDRFFEQEDDRDWLDLLDWDWT